MARVIMARKILEANDVVAAEMRDLFRRTGVRVFNLIGSPGAGKTSLLERTLGDLAGEIRAGVIEGDIATARDAERIERLGVEVVQILTGGACHIDAYLIREACADLALGELDCLFIENVGNLVCPAEFDLGEDAKVAVVSVTEGADKPEKYPLLFREAAAVVITKTDLLPYLDFDLADLTGSIRQINPTVPLFPLSARSGEGCDPWLDWLKSMIRG